MSKSVLYAWKRFYRGDKWRYSKFKFVLFMPEPEDLHQLANLKSLYARNRFNIRYIKFQVQYAMNDFIYKYGIAPKVVGVSGIIEFSKVVNEDFVKQLLGASFVEEIV